MTKTVVMYCDTGYIFPKYFILDGDYSHLNNVIVNTEPNTEEDSRLQDELSELLWDVNGNILVSMVDELPVKEIFSCPDNICLIKVGFCA